MARKSTQSTALPFAEFLRTWWYLPITVWKDTFEDFFHPQLFLGCNIEDMDDEYHVLDEVGSYGKQLSQILKVTDVLVKKMEGELSEEDQLVVRQFREYEARVAKALAESRGPQATDLTIGYVDRLESALRAKRQSDAPEEFAQLIQKLRIVVERSNGVNGVVTSN